MALEDIDDERLHDLVKLAFFWGMHPAVAGRFAQQSAHPVPAPRAPDASPCPLRPRTAYRRRFDAGRSSSREDHEPEGPRSPSRLPSPPATVAAVESTRRRSRRCQFSSGSIFIRVNFHRGRSSCASSLSSSRPPTSATVRRPASRSTSGTNTPTNGTSRRPASVSIPVAVTTRIGSAMSTA